MKFKLRTLAQTVIHTTYHSLADNFYMRLEILMIMPILTPFQLIQAQPIALL
jgi:hypothetical protein